MSKPQTRTQNIVLKHKASDCRKLHDFLSNHIKSNKIPDKIQHDLRLVIEEIFTNIINHAGVESPNSTITVEFSHSPHKINITFKDTGKAFNPLCDHKNDLDSNDRCEGGMGIHLITSLTDHQEYHRVEQINVFTVTKRYIK